MSNFFGGFSAQNIVLVGTIFPLTGIAEYKFCSNNLAIIFSPCMTQIKYINNYRLLCFFQLFWLMFHCNTPVAWGNDIIEDNEEEKSLIDNFQESGKSLFTYLKGEPTKDQLYLGMFTYHFNPKSLKTRNWSEDLVGLQYKNIFICTLRNSFYNRTWAAGFSRNFYTTELSDKWDMAIGGRVGLVYGYWGDQAPFADIAPIIPMIEAYGQFIYREHYGLELMLTTSISLSFFYQF
jgi:hypothetical protein